MQHHARITWQQEAICPSTDTPVVLDEEVDLLPHVARRALEQQRLRGNKVDVRLQPGPVSRDAQPVEQHAMRAAFTACLRTCALTHYPSQRTKDNKPRFPIFKGVRTDL